MDCSLPGSSVHGILHGQEYWSGLPCSPLGDLSHPGIERHVSYVFCIGWWVLYHEIYLRSLWFGWVSLIFIKFLKVESSVIKVTTFFSYTSHYNHILSTLNKYWILSYFSIKTWKSYYEFQLFNYDLPLVAKKKASCTKEDLHDKSSPNQTNWTLDISLEYHKPMCFSWFFFTVLKIKGINMLKL